MAYTLYDSPQTGGVFVRAVFEEAGIAYRTKHVNLCAQDHLSDEFLAINPRAQVPVLQLADGSVITEGVAIMLHIAEAHPDANLMPGHGSSERAQALRWLLFLATNIYEGENRKAYPERYVVRGECAASVREAAIDYVNRNYLVFEGSIGDGPLFFGQSLSLIDLYAWMLVQWHVDIAWISKRCPKLHRLVLTVMERPAIKPIHLENFKPTIGLKPLPA